MNEYNLKKLLNEQKQGKVMKMNKISKSNAKKKTGKVMNMNTISKSY